MQKDNLNSPETFQKDTHSTQVESDIITLTIKDSLAQYIYNRSVKISKALFLVTQHLKESDYLKRELREKAVGLSLKTFYIVKDNNTENEIDDLISILGSIHTMSDIAVSAQVLSTQSYNILKSQFAKFASELREFKTHASVQLDEKLVLNQPLPLDLEVKDIAGDSLMSIPKSVPSFFSTRPSAQNSVSGSDKQGYKVNNPSVLLTAQNKNRQSSNQITEVVTARTHKAAGEKNDRQTLILDTIRQKGELSIKDLTEVIKGCSEKTIQRELIALVGTGDLLKSGERRWSRYSIAK